MLHRSRNVYPDLIASQLKEVLQLKHCRKSLFDWGNTVFKITLIGKERKGKESKGKERKGKERKGKGREGKGREGKGREGKGRGVTDLKKFFY